MSAVACDRCGITVPVALGRPLGYWITGGDRVLVMSTVVVLCQVCYADAQALLTTWFSQRIEKRSD